MLPHLRYSAAALLVLGSVAVAPLAAPLCAQQWAGRGRLQGEVHDEQNKPLEGVKITLRQGTAPVDVKAPGPPAITTNKAGKWSYLGLAGGDWKVLLEKDGYLVSEGQVKVNEFAAAPPVVVTLKAVPKEALQAAAEATAANSAAKEVKEAIDKGNAFLTAEKPAEARAEYEKALDKVPVESKPALLRGIAQTYYREKQLDKAMATLEQAIALKPDDAETKKLQANLYVSKGIELYNGNKMPDAYAQFDKAVGLDPTMAEGFYYRGLANLAQGKNDAAKADLQKSLELDPNHPFANEARDFLKSL